MKFDLDEIQDRINDACVKACKPIADELYTEIQNTLDSVHKYYPIKDIRFSMGCCLIDGGIINYYDEDGEESKVSLGEFLSDWSFQQSYYWDKVDLNVKDDVQHLGELLEFLNGDQRYIRTKTFIPKH